ACGAFAVRTLSVRVALPPQHNVDPPRRGAAPLRWLTNLRAGRPTAGTQTFFELSVKCGRKTAGANLPLQPGAPMKSRVILSIAVLWTSSLSSAIAAPAATGGAGEYAKHFDALAKLSVAVAQAMPADQYGFRPH